MGIDAIATGFSVYLGTGISPFFGHASNQESLLDGGFHFFKTNSSHGKSLGFQSIDQY
jgi:hypothetical protein